MDSTVPLLDISIQNGDDNAEFGSILKRVKPDWTDKVVKFKDLSGNGYINKNVACYVGDNPDLSSVVIRVFEEEMLQRFRKDIEVGHMLVNKYGLSPRLLCRFHNGVCMQYQPGECFTWKTTKSLYHIDIEEAIAHEIAKYHRAELYEAAVEADVAEKFAGLDREWTGYRWRVLMNKPAVPREFIECIPSQDIIYKEIQEVENVLRRLQSPRRFCHMDINPTNIIYDQSEKRAYIVDYENPCIFFVACDVAWYFLTFFDLTHIDYQADYPSDEYRRAFITKYLNYRVTVENREEPVSETEIDVFCKHVNIAFLLMLLRTVIIGYVLYSYEPPHAPIPMLTSMIGESWRTYNENKSKILADITDADTWSRDFSSFYCR